MNGARASARTFVALSLGPELGARVAERLTGVLDPRRFRVARAEGLHLTLAFLGDVERERLVDLSAGLREALAEPLAPELALGGTGAFPDPRRPRVLWIGVEERAPTGRLAACRTAVLDGLAAEGVTPRERAGEPFRPHVTVARPRGHGRLPEAFQALRFELDWRPGAVELFESSLASGGSRYECLERFPFVPDP